MSDRVTQETCPKCQDTAVVRWVTVREITGPSVVRFSTEFDCATGCALTEDERWTAFDSLLWT